MPKHQRQSGFTAVEAIVIILVLVVLGGAGWYVWKSKNTSTKSTSSSSSSGTQQRTSSATVPAGWATYTSKLGGFSFKYTVSGWKFSAYDDNAGTWKDGSAAPNTASEIELTEDAGQGSSTDNTQFDVSAMIGDQNDVKQNAYGALYGQGSVSQTFGNGIGLWLLSEQAAKTSSASKCGGKGGITLFAASNGNLYASLHNGKKFSLNAGFCVLPGRSLAQTYQQQLADTEVTVVKDLISSITYSTR